MSDYFIGDVQGCFQGLQKALAEIQFVHGRDTLWLTGDLVARGESSLKTLQFLTKHESSIRTVLGNHDLHFLSVANGIKKSNPKDNLAPLLDSNKCVYYCDWLRQQPLLLSLPDSAGFMSHAGLPPLWTAKKAQKWAAVVQQQLQSSQYSTFLPLMYGNKPEKWAKSLSDEDKLKFTVNALTRMRFCTKDGALNFTDKSSPLDESSLNDSNTLIPWYKFDESRFDDSKWIFGHWAALMGKTDNPNIIGLDTGFVWGNFFTILHWQDQKKIEISA